jgi:predicted nicotinamide N-methyase
LDAELEPGALRSALHDRGFGCSVALQRPPLCPEIALWLIDEDVDLEAACAALHDGEPPPYWGFCWGAGQALARYVLDHPTEVAGRQVVDFGSGSGIVGIAAALAGARTVTCVDIDPNAREAARTNATANHIAPGILSTSASFPSDCEVLLASDVIYEQAAAAHVEVAQSQAKSTLVAEPHRPGNQGLRQPALASYQARTIPDVDSPTTAASVYRITS